MAEGDDRIPVIIGVGQVNDRPVDDAEGLDSLQLMVAAARAADGDAGGGWIARCDWMGIVRQLSFPALDTAIPSALPAALGVAPGHVEQSAYQSGDSPIRFVNDAANAIGRGACRVALVVGGEALRTAARRPDGGGIGRATRAPGGASTRASGGPPTLPVKYGLRTPTDIYPLYENALRAAEGRSLAEAQAETGTIWALMSEVAAGNPTAWLRQARTAEDIIQPSADNRPIAFPYTKLMVANSSVNQGAALIVTSLAEARAAGVREDRLVYVGLGAAAHEARDHLCRARFDASPAMQVTLEHVLAVNGVEAAALDLVELYSCFPCVPKLARRTLGLPADRAATVFGGLTFGGGPIGNYMTHAAAGMVERLRETPGDGLLYANGGFATHNHAILVTTRPQPAGTFPQEYDVQAEADARRGRVPALTDAHEGEAEIETYTVIYDRDGAPSHGVVLARTPGGERAIARVLGDDHATIAFLTGEHEPVGTRGHIRREGDHARWSGEPGTD